MTSSSRDGRSGINLAFNVDINFDEAASDVRDAVSRVTGRLPQEADPPQIAKANTDSFPIMFFGIQSTTMNRLQLTDYIRRYVLERFATIPGVARVLMPGSQTYTMRVWLDPTAMAARGLTVDDVQTALVSQNLELPAGSLEAAAKDFTIRVARGYSTPEDFERLPITAGGAAARSVQTSGSAALGGRASTAGAPQGLRPAVTGLGNAGAYVVRLGDIARIEEGPNDVRRKFHLNGVDQIGMGIGRQSRANDLEIAANVLRVMDEVNKTLPEGTQMNLSTNSTQYTSQAIHEVWITMLLSLGLVGLVNFLFLGTLRAAVIPTIVAPICILSTFIVLAILGFSINLLTLLALVLAIGLVVDDAIVVTENIQRHVDDGEPPAVAAQRGTRQVFFAVVATTLVLLAVFAPLMFMSGQIGRLFVELAVTVAAAVFFSAVLARSLSPMLASKVLRPARGQGFAARAVDNAMRRLRASYRASLDVLLTVRVAGFAAGGLVLVLAAVAVGLFLVLPSEMVPAEDRGRVTITATGPEGSSYDYMEEPFNQIEAHLLQLRQDGVVPRILVMAPPPQGGNRFNVVQANTTLPPTRDRTISAGQFAAQLNREFSTMTSVRVSAVAQQGFGRRGARGNSITLLGLGNEYPAIAEALQPVRRAVEANPGFGRVNIGYEPTSPRLQVEVDREKRRRSEFPRDRSDGHCRPCSALNG